MRKTLYYNK